MENAFGPILKWLVQEGIIKELFESTSGPLSILRQSWAGWTFLWRSGLLRRAMNMTIMMGAGPCHSTESEPRTPAFVRRSEYNKYSDCGAPADCGELN